MSMELPRGKKSVVTLAPDGASVLKRYNANGDAHDKCVREVAFYRHYAGAEQLPPLLDAGDDWIRLGVVRADRLTDQSVRDVSTLTESCANALIGLYAKAPAPDPGTLAACGARSARVTRDRTFEALVGYATAGPPSAIIDAIRFSLARIVLTRDLLTKLDWSSRHIFVEGGRVVRFARPRETEGLAGGRGRLRAWSCCSWRSCSCRAACSSSSSRSMKLGLRPFLLLPSGSRLALATADVTCCVHF